MLALDKQKFEITTRRGYWKGLSDSGRYRQKQKVRTIKYKGFTIEEGIIIEYEEYSNYSKRWSKDAQQHLVGYHYISVLKGETQIYFTHRIRKSWFIYRDKDTSILGSAKSRKEAIKKMLNLIKLK